MNPSQHSSFLRITAFFAALAWMAVIYSISSLPSLPGTVFFPGQDKLFHGVMYGILGLFYLWAQPTNRITNALLASLLATVYGIIDEWHQSFIPGRTADIWDVFADASGALIATLAFCWLIKHYRHKKQQGT